ncbi:hypothetical protein SDC9_136198 [bioreactor metagenome]|uniref:Uncharacterized protein n=1 Tax=bioreactor metagenome TaxID=1076179 RepID=A0A645DHY3_9ZZZZ
MIVLQTYKGFGRPHDVALKQAQVDQVKHGINDKDDQKDHGGNDKQVGQIVGKPGAAQHIAVAQDK